MAKITLYLDKRKSLADHTYPIKIRVTQKGQNGFLLSSGIYVSEKNWINDKIVGNPALQSVQNTALKFRINKIESALLQLEMSGKLLSMTNNEIKKNLENLINNRVDPTKEYLVKTHFEHFLSFKTKNNTIYSYRQTLAKISMFTDTEQLKFEDINLLWLKEFERYLHNEKLSTNSVAIHFRNLRSIFNNAIDEDIVSQNLYPFRKFKIKSEETSKRSLTIEELRCIRDYKVEPHQEFYRDIFMLIFYLIGINLVDLRDLKEIDNNGRVVFNRSKTSKLYSIRVEPEALAIIDKYRGVNHLLKFGDSYVNYRDFGKKLNKNLQGIGEVRLLKHGKKSRTPIFPHITTYWARHTWATVAAELDIPDATISLALGHSSGNHVTNIYINRNRKKIDEANRKVIDYIMEKEIAPLI